LGGAVSAHIAAKNLLPTLCLSVIDVVEGSAMDALQNMQTYLSSRPKQFGSLEQGILWHLHSRTIRNRESARVSVPALLIQDHGQYKWRTDLAKTRPFWEGTDVPSLYYADSDWFKGLSGKFLASRAGKLLLLAGTDRLDKPLMIGQMQGFTLVIWELIWNREVSINGVSGCWTFSSRGFTFANGRYVD
jgi:protein phosphatase methylesterase 1